MPHPPRFSCTRGYSISVSFAAMASRVLISRALRITAVNTGHLYLPDPIHSPGFEGILDAGNSQIYISNANHASELQPSILNCLLDITIWIEDLLGLTCLRMSSDIPPNWLLFQSTSFNKWDHYLVRCSCQDPRMTGDDSLSLSISPVNSASYLEASASFHPQVTIIICQCSSNSSFSLPCGCHQTHPSHYEGPLEILIIYSPLYL